VFKSTDGGDSWTAVITGATRAVYALAVDPTTPATLYAGTERGVFKSTDEGANWTINGLLGVIVRALVIDPTTPATLYAGTEGGGVFQSTDAAASWTAVNAGLTSTYVLALAIDPINPDTLYAGTFFDGGVFQSTGWRSQLNGGEHRSEQPHHLCFGD
jgi:photosystem II stability/assembly factor-like uncharacterized protein